MQRERTYAAIAHLVQPLPVHGIMVQESSDANGRSSFAVTLGPILIPCKNRTSARRLRDQIAAAILVAQ